MSHADVHLGRLRVNNELNVEDKATCESDLEVKGKIICERLKLGKTTFTENDLKNAGTASKVKGVIDDASDEPATKLMKLDETTNTVTGSVIGIEETENKQ